MFPSLGPSELSYLVTKSLEQSYSTTSNCPSTKGSSRDLRTNPRGEEGLPKGVELRDCLSVLGGRPKIEVYTAACPRPYPKSRAAVEE